VPGTSIPRPKLRRRDRFRHAVRRRTAQNHAGRAGSYYRVKNYSKTVEWIQRYEKAGGMDRNVDVLLIQSYYLKGDYVTAAKELQGEIKTTRRQERPHREQLQLLANCYLKQNDAAGYTQALEQLVGYTPRRTTGPTADLCAKKTGILRPPFARCVPSDVGHQQSHGSF